MVDNVNPNSQFHPYQPMNETPVSERMPSGLNGMLNSVRNLNAKNPGLVLGGLAALAIGFGLLRSRR